MVVDPSALALPVHRHKPVMSSADMSLGLTTLALSTPQGEQRPPCQ